MIGTADAALIGVLLAAGVATSPAIATVMAFRIVAFWPLPWWEPL